MTKRTAALLTALLLTLLVVSCSAPATDQGATTSVAPTEATSTTALVTTTTVPVATTTIPLTTTTTAASFDVLVFHKTGGFRHPSIEVGIAALEDMASSGGFTVFTSEDGAIFAPGELDDYEVVAFLSTTRDVLDESQQAAMEEHIRSGKGFVGVHAAADTEYQWPWYGGLVGAYFDGHPAVQPAQVDLALPATHPIVEGLPTSLELRDEWYDFRAHPGPEVTILATVDETTYEGGTMGEPHPIAWAQEYDGGRSVYLGFGHTPESFSQPFVRDLLENALRWAAGPPS